MWYIPFFVSLLLYYTGCFLGYRSGDHPRRTLSWWTLTVFSGVYYWYLVTEGQIFSVYFITFVVMIGYMVYKKQKHNAHLDINGQFLLYSFALCFILILIWVSYLWNDEALRVKYPKTHYSHWKTWSRQKPQRERHIGQNGVRKQTLLVISDKAMQIWISR